jgi:DNA-binding FadR family transcriptional regulator
MNVSRASLREALVALEVAGIVRVKPGSGVFIAENALENLIKISDVTSLISPLEILEARSLLEPQISGLAATRRTKSDLTNLQQLNEVMEARLDEELDSWDADWGFHAAIAQASKNSSAQRLLENIREQMDQPVWALTRARNLKRNDHGRKYLREHQEIYDSLELGDSGIAKKSMAKHIKSITQDLDEVHERGVRLIRSVKA